MKSRLVTNDALLPERPLAIRMSRQLARRIGALAPVFGLNLEQPVLLVEPTDGMAPGMFWPIQDGAYER